MPAVKVAEWLNERPEWFREAAKLLLDNGTVSDLDCANLKKLCLKEVVGGPTGAGYTLPTSVFDTADESKIKLSTIGEIQGINALSPKDPLAFGAGNLAVVYGQNGSGKSGYVRIMKHVCGAKNPGKLHPNVYLPTPTTQQCSIGYEKDDVLLNENWDASAGSLEDLQSVDIFDTSSGKVYIASENEVTYEPSILSFLTELISVCEKVSNIIDGDIEKLPSVKPELPKEYLSTECSKWYGKITAKTKDTVVIKNTSWTEQDEEKVIELQKRLSEKDPLTKAQKIRQQQGHIKKLIKNTVNLVGQLSDAKCKIILDSKIYARNALETAEVAATKVFKSAPLDGVGSDVWKQLWEHARSYSQEAAYVDKTFPHVEEYGRCVLCQQLLSDEAKQRTLSFEEFVKGTTQSAADKAQSDVATLLKATPDIPKKEDLEAKLDAAGMPKDKDYTFLLDLYELLRSRKTLLTESEKFEDLKVIPDLESWKVKVQELFATYEDSAKKYESDAKAGDRSGLQSQLNELLARKWLSQQVKSIKAEIGRLQKVQALKLAKKSTNTRSLSTKKGELAGVLITDAFVIRFNKELENLGAKHIQVELIKSRITKGKVLHRLKLIGTKTGAPEDVLSEGEHRIVSLAAFLADVTGKFYSAPFVFDDPISSLDQVFEEAVVQRLVELSTGRQVIVFTHRLSLLGLIQDYAKKAEVICVRKEAWGTGEPGGTPLFAKRPDKALKVLLNERLVKAKKILGDHGHEVYDPYAKSLCSDFRILVERMVECHLLADVVQRYRRAINTMGKIEGLAKINTSDCQLIDALMTKYSRYEHSQPLEAPVSMPLPTELEADFITLQSWHSEFITRPVSVVEEITA